jgi:hypothetical protein
MAAQDNQLSDDSFNQNGITKNEQELYIKQKEWAHFDTAEKEYEYASQTEKTCSKCNSTKMLICFSGNTSGSCAFDKDGYRLRRPECKHCSKNISRGKTEAKKLAKQMGIAYKAPEGTKCALCNTIGKKGDFLVFDHCHTTNKFRGYLHNSCNRSLGVLGDNVEGLLRAVAYLNKSEDKMILQDELTGDFTTATK